MTGNITLFTIDIDNPFIKLLLPLLAIAFIVILCRFKWKISLKHNLMLVPPRVKDVIIWSAANIAWMLSTDYFINWRGQFDFTVWQVQPLYVSVLRVMAVCFAGPVAEELLFRGVVFYKLNKFGARTWLTVLITAAVWALIHYNYSPTVIFIIFIEGLLLGTALLRSKSLYVPIIMHICWNLYAIW